MTLSEAITLAVSHHPTPSRQLKWYWKHKIILAGMKEEIIYNANGYNRESLLNWLAKLRGNIVPIHLHSDVRKALHGKDKREVSEIINSAIRESLSK